MHVQAIPNGLVTKEPTSKLRQGTLPKTNIAPENGWLEDYFPFQKA